MNKKKLLKSNVYLFKKLIFSYTSFHNCYDFAISLYYNHNGHTNNLTYSNLALNNTPQLFGDWDNDPIQP